MIDREGDVLDVCGIVFAQWNRIIVDGTSNRISIFALDGKAVSITPILSGNKTIIKLDGLNQGVYIIKINNKSIKIARQ